MPNTREKLIGLVDEAEEHATDICVFHDSCEDCPGRKYGNKCRDYLKADHLIANGVTVQECKAVEIDQFRLPIDDAILILTEELKQMSDGYTTHLAYGGKGDPAMEANLNALELAISELESQKRMMPQPSKGE